MLRLLQLIVFGHIHYYETVDTYNLSASKSTAVGTRYVLRCSKCGNVKFKDVI